MWEVQRWAVKPSWVSRGHTASWISWLVWLKIFYSLVLKRWRPRHASQVPNTLWSQMCRIFIAVVSAMTWTFDLCIWWRFNAQFLQFCANLCVWSSSTGLINQSVNLCDWVGGPIIYTHAPSVSLIFFFFLLMPSVHPNQPIWSPPQA